MSNVVYLNTRTCAHSLNPIPKRLSSGDIIHLKRQRRLLSQTLSDLRHKGGKRLVVMRTNGSVLSDKTGTFEFNLKQPFEVSQGTDPKMLGGTAVVSQEEALRKMAGNLGGILVCLEKRLRTADAL